MGKQQANVQGNVPPVQPVGDEQYEVAIPLKPENILGYILSNPDLTERFEELRQRYAIEHAQSTGFEHLNERPTTDEGLASLFVDHYKQANRVSIRLQISNNVLAWASFGVAAVFLFTMKWRLFKYYDSIIDNELSWEYMVPAATSSAAISATVIAALIVGGKNLRKASGAVLRNKEEELNEPFSN